MDRTHACAESPSRDLVTSPTSDLRKGGILVTLRNSLACLAALVAVLALFVVGCVPQTGDDGTITIQSKNTPDPDNYVRLALLTNPPDLDPVLISDTTSDGVGSKIFNTLLGYDENLELVPDLAALMPTVSDDGLVYTFILREGVKFHNGREVTAADFKYSLERLASTASKRPNVVKPIRGATAAIESGRTGGPTTIEGIRVVDDRTLEITLEKPYYPFLYLMAMTNAAVVPKEVVEEKGSRFSREPVGTGPFVLTEWVENDHMTLDRFDDYFEGPAKIAGIELRVIPEPLARVEEYKAGNLDIIDVTQGMLPRWRNSNHKEDVLVYPQASILYYGFNLEKEGSPYAGYGESARKLREAANWAVDRQYISDRILDGRHTPSNGLVPPGLPGHAEDRPAFTQDLDKAKKLMEEAGYPNGEGLPEVSLWFNQQGDNAKVAQTVQQDLAQIGMKVNLKQLDWAAYIEATDAGEPSFFRLGWVADYPDPENFMYFLFHSVNKGPNGNVSFYDRPEVDALIDESYGMTDPEERFATLRKAEELILGDYPWLFLTSVKEGLLVKPYLKNFEPTAMDDDSAGGSQVEWHKVEIVPASAQ